MSKIKCTTLANASDSRSVPVDTVVQGSAKAWVSFNGTGTVAINAAFNVSSITDNGTGNYTVNLTNAMPNADYCIVSSCFSEAVGYIAINVKYTPVPTASSYCLTTGRVTGNEVVLDISGCYSAVFS